MRNLWRFLGVTVSAGVVLGGVVVIGMWHGKQDGATPVAVKPGTVSLNDSVSANGAGGQVTPGLSVTTDGNQGMVAGASTNSGANNGGGGSSSGSSGGSNPAADGNGLPTPSQFHVYDQYKNNATALFIDTKPGTGKAVAQGSQVTIQYRGWLTDGTEFDETYARGKPYTFKEGDGTVITGVAQAVFGMKAGGTRRLIIPPTVGYGAAGHNPIPPDAVLVFDVELVSVQ